jgi:hypothetical protein
MHILNLPEFSFRTRNEKGQVMIFDEFRKKWVVITPEEWVRQNMLKYLNLHKGYPSALMSLEKKVLVNGLSQRYDLLVHDRSGKPMMVAEFKAPGVAIDQSVVDQAIRYNNMLLAPWILISNGLNHYVCHLDMAAGSYSFMNDIPLFVNLKQTIA